MRYVQAPLILITFFGTLACDGPTVDEYADRRGVIDSSLIYPAGAARGDVYVFAYAEDDLPPPEGSGRPVQFVVVTRERLFGSAPEGEARNWNAPFTIPSVRPGRYQLRAFLDADGDFSPLNDLLAQPSAGDVLGAALDGAGNYETIEVRANEISGREVFVVLGRVAPFERPAFSHTSATRLSLSAGRFANLVLDAKAIDRPPLEMAPESARFLVEYVGFDAAGAPIDENGDHLPDVYPRVILRSLSASTSTSSSVVIPLITNPMPFLDELDASGFASTDRLELIVPPVALEIDASGARRVLASVPVGRYETIVISGTGQTWTVPNSLDTDFPGGPDPSQSVEIEIEAPPPPAAGRIEGLLTIATDVAAADAFVFAFARDPRNPPPPDGFARPVQATLVPRGAFATSSSGASAPFEIGDLPPGDYTLLGLLDVGSHFVPFIDLLAIARAGDVVGRTEVVSATPIASGVGLRLDTEIPFDAPSFELASEPVLDPVGPTRIVLAARAIEALGIRESSNQFPILPLGSDLDGDGISDVSPRVVLTRMIDGAPPESAENDPDVVVFALADPLPFVTELGTGSPLTPSSDLPILIPPRAWQTSQSRFIPIPDGRYRINLLTGFAQSWSVPNVSNLLLGRAGTELEDATQAAFLNVDRSRVPGGVIRGVVRSPAGNNGRRFVVVAFDSSDLPPPRGRGKPAAATVIESDGSDTAAFELIGLPSGSYVLRAFADDNRNFSPWYHTHDQPDRGDEPGAALNTVDVSALGPATEGVEIILPAAPRYGFDRPVFELPADLQLNPNGNPITSVFETREWTSEVLRARGVFPIQWVDLNGDGTADDVNGDAQPDVFPLVIAEQLDLTDPEGLRALEGGDRIFGVVDPAQFAAAGFPALDPTATSTVVGVGVLGVVFPPIAVHSDGQTGRPNVGSYRVSLINADGQTWTVPNELQRARSHPQAMAQSRVLTVSEP